MREIDEEEEEEEEAEENGKWVENSITTQENKAMNMEEEHCL